METAPGSRGMQKGDLESKLFLYRQVPLSLSRGNREGTNQTGVARDLLPVYGLLALVPRAQASGKATTSPGLPSLSELQFPATPAQPVYGLCVRLARCLLGNVVEVFPE